VSSLNRGFERDALPQGGIDSYGTALCWTAMILTTMGSDYSPKTAEGRTLCVATTRERSGLPEHVAFNVARQLLAFGRAWRP